MYRGRECEDNKSCDAGTFRGWQANQAAAAKGFGTTYQFQAHMGGVGVGVTEMRTKMRRRVTEMEGFKVPVTKTSV